MQFPGDGFALLSSIEFTIGGQVGSDASTIRKSGLINERKSKTCRHFINLPIMLSLGGEREAFGRFADFLCILIIIKLISMSGRHRSD